MCGRNACRYYTRCGFEQLSLLFTNNSLYYEGVKRFGIIERLDILGARVIFEISSANKMHLSFNRSALHVPPRLPPRIDQLWRLYLRLRPDMPPQNLGAHAGARAEDVDFVDNFYAVLRDVLG